MLAAQFLQMVKNRLDYDARTPYGSDEALLGPISRALAAFSRAGLTSSGRRTAAVVGGDVDLLAARVALPLTVFAGGAALRDPTGRTRPISPVEISRLAPDASSPPKWWGMVGPLRLKVWPSGAQTVEIEGFVLHPALGAADLADPASDSVRLPDGDAQEAAADLAAAYAMRPRASGDQLRKSLDMETAALRTAAAYRAAVLAGNPAAAAVAAAMAPDMGGGSR